MKYQLFKAATNIYRYNSNPHPMPFMKVTNIFAPTKSTSSKPDLEEAFEEEDVEELAEPRVEDDDEADIKKDKYIKQPKAKKATVGKKGASKKKKKTAKDEDEDEDDFDLEDVKPKKGMGKAAAKGKGKK